MKVHFTTIQLNGSNYNDDIDSEKTYAVKYKHELSFGRFTEQWYGWAFKRDVDQKFMQLNFINEVYECIDIAFKENTTRSISISRNISKVLKDPSVIGLKFDDSGRISVVDLMEKWKSSTLKYNLSLADIERFVKKGQQSKYRFSISECYISVEN